MKTLDVVLNYFRDKKWSFLFILGALALFSYLICLFYVQTGFDHSFYIGSSRLIMEGKYPFVDFNPGYPPLVFYLMTIPLSVFPDNVYTHLATIYFIIFIDAFLIYILSIQICKHKPISVFASIYFLLLSLCFDGMFFLLEPFVLFFGLISLIFVQRNNIVALILAGVFSFCASWCKQYGIGFVCLCCLYQIIVNRTIVQKMRGAFLIAAGFLLSCCAFYGINMLQGIELSDISMLSGSTYKRYGMNSFLDGYIKLFKRVPSVLPCLVFAAYLGKRLVNSPVTAICIAGIIGFMMQCYVRNYDHYILLALPFSVLLIPILYSYINGSIMKRCFLFIIIVSSLMKVWTICRTDYHILLSNSREKEYIWSQELATIIPYGTDNVYVSLWSLPSSTHNYYKPSMLKEYGMTNGFALEPLTTKKYLSTCNYCIIDDLDLNNRNVFDTDNLLLLDKTFIKIDSINSLQSGRTFIYKRISYK